MCLSTSLHLCFSASLNQQINTFCISTSLHYWFTVLSAALHQVHHCTTAHVSLDQCFTACITASQMNASLLCSSMNNIIISVHHCISASLSLYQIHCICFTVLIIHQYYVSLSLHQCITVSLYWCSVHAASLYYCINASMHQCHWSNLWHLYTVYWDWSQDGFTTPVYYWATGRKMVRS